MLNFETTDVLLSEDQGAGPVPEEFRAEIAATAVGRIVHDFPDEPGRTFRLVLRSLVEYPVKIDRVVASFLGDATMVLEHGWQSWSTVRRTRPLDVRPERSSAPRWFKHEMTADGGAVGNALLCDTFCLTDQFILGALSEKTSFITFEVDDGRIHVNYLLEGLVLEPGEDLELDTLWYADGKAGPNYSSYATAAGLANNARVDRGAPTGWCSWYQYFGNLNSVAISENAALAAEHGLAVVQIDDGWQRSIGEWDSTRPEFGEPIEDLAASIVRDGGVAGIWTAPFLAMEGSPLATEHPEWLLRHVDGRPVTALVSNAWGGKSFALDTTNDAVLKHLEETYRDLVNKGFEYFKIDFLFAAAIPGVRVGDGDVTRATALRLGLEAIRKGIGEDAYLLGCGSPLLGAVGYVDAMRVSEDVAPFWQPEQFFEGFPECTVAAQNAVEQSVLRAPLHRRWFLNDPDCALLRPTDTRLTSEERLVLLRTIMGTGGYLIVSDDLSLYTGDEWDLLHQAMDAQEFADGTLDLVDPFAITQTVKGPHFALKVNWALPSAQLLRRDGTEVLSAS
jgi:alpha-galactosidase